MWRELAQILLSIHISTHAIPDSRQLSLAKHIQKRAEYAGVDPYVIVAIITHESQWSEGTISQDGLDFGLMQVRGANYGSSIQYLLNGETNINAGTYIIKSAREYCQKVLHREPLTQEWLAVYQGSSSGFKCKPTKLTKKFEDYALCIEANVESNRNYNCKHIYWSEIKNTEEQETYNE
jgi:hypothetical protein